MIPAADRLIAEPGIRSGLAATLPRVLPPGHVTVDAVRRADAVLAAARRVAPVAPLPTIHRIARRDGSLLEVRLHEAPGSGAILWIHGGGMFLGSAKADDPLCAALRDDLGVAVAAVDYRLAPEHRHPEPLLDCLRALEWLNPRGGPLVVAGLSAGGGLATAVALAVRDRGGPGLAAVHAYFAMLDDRPTRSRTTRTDAEVWDARLDRLAWASYLGETPADALAAPARAEDLSGLPPFYIDAGERDLFRSEDAEFADRLRYAGVPVEFHLHEDAVHAHELVMPDSPTAHAIRAARLAALRQVFVNRKDTRVER